MVLEPLLHDNAAQQKQIDSDQLQRQLQVAGTQQDLIENVETSLLSLLRDIRPESSGNIFNERSECG